jgi:hypothetical protein
MLLAGTGVTGTDAVVIGATTVPSESAAMPESAVIDTVGPAAMAPTCAVARGITVRNGNSATQAANPSDQCSRPSEMFNRARTTAGSNCVPLWRANSSRASVAFIGFLYDRTAVMTSKESATLTIRAANAMSSPESPRG